MKKLFLLLAASASAPMSLFGQAPAPIPAPAAPDLPRAASVLDAMLDAGPVMLVLLIMSVFSVMMVIVFLLTVRRGAIVTNGYMATAEALLRKRDYLGLLAVSNRHSEAIARVVQRMLDFTTKNPNADMREVREIAETEGTRVAAALNNKVTYLADIGMIAPMVGLLGTVIGIIRSFGALGADLGSARYALLSKGISEALINTSAGLAIGIPAMIAYAFFRGRSQRLISDLEAASAHIVALFSLHYTRHDGRKTERSPALIEDEF